MLPGSAKNKKKSRENVSQFVQETVLLPKQILRAHTYMQEKYLGGSRPKLNAAFDCVSRVTNSGFPVEKTKWFTK